MDIPYIDGTEQIVRVSQNYRKEDVLSQAINDAASTTTTTTTKRQTDDDARLSALQVLQTTTTRVQDNPPFGGALVGKGLFFCSRFRLVWSLQPSFGGYCNISIWCPYFLKLGMLFYKTNFSLHTLLAFEEGSVALNAHSKGCNFVLCSLEPFFFGRSTKQTFLFSLIA